MSSLKPNDAEHVGSLVGTLSIETDDYPEPADVLIRRAREMSDPHCRDYEPITYRAMLRALVVIEERRGEGAPEPKRTLTLLASDEDLRTLRYSQRVYGDPASPHYHPTLAALLDRLLAGGAS